MIPRSYRTGAFLLLLAYSLAAGPLEQADELIRSGEIGPAETLLEEWIAAADGNDVLACEVNRRLAVLALLVEDFERAGAYWRAAAALCTGETRTELLYRAAVADFQLGYFGAVREQAYALIQICSDVMLLERIKVLLSRALYLSGEKNGALDLFTGDLAARRTLLPETCLWLYRLSAIQGREKMKTEVYDVLADTYPDSIELQLAGNTTLYYPTAVELMGLYGSGLILRNSDTPPEPAAKLYMVQTGSFTERENAEDSLAGLEKEGFAGEIQRTERNGTIYYRVLIVDIPAEDTANVLNRLKDKGYEGWKLPQAVSD